MSTAYAMLSNRVTSNPEGAFVSCTSLPVNQTELSQSTMAEVEGGGPWLVAIAGGIAGVYIYDRYEEEIDAVLDPIFDKIEEILKKVTGPNVAGNYAHLPFLDLTFDLFEQSRGRYFIFSAIALILQPAGIKFNVKIVSDFTDSSHGN